MEFSHPDNLYWIALSHLEGMGIKRLTKWLETRGDLASLFKASTIVLQSVGFSKELIHSIHQMNWSQVEKEIQWYEKNDCHLITFQDEDYPALLKEISSLPPVLFIRGNKALLNQPQLAIVGSRNPTPLGIETAEEFAYLLAEAGLTVTSGLAAGIDAASHRGALQSQAQTIGVMGTGLKTIYPRSNSQLAEEMLAKGGALVSEFSLESPAKANYFPLRNRIISGLSLGILVVEAARKSGSLITAKLGLEQGREIFAIPGSIHHPLSKGCHDLIRQGAKLVESIEDILVELPVFKDCTAIQKGKALKPPLKQLKKEEQQLLSGMGYEVNSLDRLVMRSGLTASQVSSMLLSLELMGYVTAKPGGYLRST